MHLVPLVVSEEPAFEWKGMFTGSLNRLKNVAICNIRPKHRNANKIVRGYINYDTIAFKPQRSILFAKLPDSALKQRSCINLFVISRTCSAVCPSMWLNFDLLSIYGPMKGPGH